MTSSASMIPASLKGDTISTGKTFHFARMPRFSPEHFARVSTRDALKYKQFHKGLTELAEEGAVQVFTAAGSGQIILGAVGELQFEVFQYRMKNEYGVDSIMQRLPIPFAPAERTGRAGLPDRHGMIVTDRDGDRFVLLKTNSGSG